MRDVVVAGAQSASSVEIAQILERLEIIPELVVNGMQVLDVPRILRRKPGVCLIDGLAHDKIRPSWPRELNAGKTACPGTADRIRHFPSSPHSLNLQHVEEKSVHVGLIRGKKSVSTVPEAFIKRADEIIIVDAPPEYCLEHGHDPNRFLNPKMTPEQQLSALREIALLLAADVVDHQLAEYMKTNGIVQNYGTQERVMVCITPRTNAAVMIRRGRRQANRFHGELFVAYVEQPHLPEEDQKIARPALWRSPGKWDAATSKSCQAKNRSPRCSTSLASKASRKSSLATPGGMECGIVCFGTPLERLIFEADGIDVRVFPHP